MSMIKTKSKHDQIEISPGGAANNRGDPRRLLAARGDPPIIFLAWSQRSPAMGCNIPPLPEGNGKGYAASITGHQ